MDWMNSAHADVADENAGLSQRLAEGGEASHADRDARLGVIVSVLKKSPAGARLLAEAVARGVEIEITEEEADYGGYTEATPWSPPMVRLNPGQSDANMVAVLAHELRHSHHDAQGFMLSANRPPMEGLITNRLSEADAEVAAVAVCDELEPIGITSPMDTLGRLGTAFRNMVARSPEKRENGAAYRAVFNMWFTGRALVDTYDANVAAFYEANPLVVLNGRKAGYAPPPSADLARQALGTLPNGVFYLAEDPKMGPPLDGEFYRNKIADETQISIDKLEQRLGRDDRGPAPSF